MEVTTSAADSAAGSHAEATSKGRSGSKKRAARRSRSRKALLPEGLTLDLNAPGMTPMLRAGLGGLAASLYAFRRVPDWHADPVSVGPGEDVVESKRIRLAFGGNAEAFFSGLFEQAFVIRNGLIDLPGQQGSTPPDDLHALELQRALKRTFLQHGKSTTKRGKEQLRSVTVDDTQHFASFQAYETYAHRKEGAALVLSALTKGQAAVAGWASPGSAQRHVAFGQSKWAFDAASMLCALFSVVGCVSLHVPGNGGALIIPVPSDLVRFARVRHLLTPESARAVHVAGEADGALQTALALRAQQTMDLGGVASTHGVLLRATPWASQQKSRVGLLSNVAHDARTMAMYATLAKTLPARVRARNVKKPGAEEDYFIATSALRGFISENLATGRPWHRGFATAHTGGKERRFIHYFRGRDNLGALFREEKEGLVAMLEHLEEAERALVSSVHDALRRRFGKIYDETRDASPKARQNRYKRESERARLSFKGAKTQDQLRSALTAFLTGPGHNAGLVASWQPIWRLMDAEHWQAARDLALIGLASYRSQRKEEQLAMEATTDGTMDDEEQLA